MGKCIKVIHRVADMFEKIALFAAILMLVAMLCAITLGVYVRLFLNGGFIWTDEFSRWCLVDSAFIGGAVMLRRGDLVTLDILVDRLGKKARAVADCVILFLCGIFLLVFLREGYSSIFTYMGYRALTMPTNQAVPLVGMEIGGALMLLFTIEKFIYRLCAVFELDTAAMTGADVQKGDVAE